uniref:Uncharacterized protein MANES_04G086000 n=1 Tax=Rhizophora mucronata TaxID=61149 RepID=A0A2P2IUE9_RHIMU
MMKPNFIIVFGVVLHVFDLAMMNVTRGVIVEFISIIFALCLLLILAIFTPVTNFT